MKKLNNAFIILGLIFIIEIILSILKTPHYLVPKPSLIFQYILLNYNEWYLHFLFTLGEAITGLIIGTIIGFSIAAAFIFYPKLKEILYPIIVFLETIPLVATAPLFAIWFGNGFFSKTLVVIIICLFPILVTSYDGLKSVNKQNLLLLESYKATKWQIFTKLRFFYGLSHLFSALKIISTFAILAALTAELFSASKGMGYLILVFSSLFKIPNLFGIVVISAILSLSFFLFFSYLERKIIYWEV